MIGIESRKSENKFDYNSNVLSQRECSFNNICFYP